MSLQVAATAGPKRYILNVHLSKEDLDMNLHRSYPVKGSTCYKEDSGKDQLAEQEAKLVLENFYKRGTNPILMNQDYPYSLDKQSLPLHVTHYEKILPGIYSCLSVSCCIDEHCEFSLKPPQCGYCCDEKLMFYCFRTKGSGPPELLFCT